MGFPAPNGDPAPVLVPLDVPFPGILGVLLWPELLLPNQGSPKVVLLVDDEEEEEEEEDEPNPKPELLVFDVCLFKENEFELRLGVDTDDPEEDPMDEEPLPLNNGLFEPIPPELRFGLLSPDPGELTLDPVDKGVFEELAPVAPSRVDAGLLNDPSELEPWPNSPVDPVLPCWPKLVELGELEPTPQRFCTGVPGWWARAPVYPNPVWKIKNGQF